MKYVPRSRNLVAVVLVLLLAAASAPAALALPAGPGAGVGSGMTWDVQAFFGWVQGLLGGFFGGGGGEEEPSGITDKARAESDVNGHDLKAASTVETTEDTPTLQDGSLGR